MNAFFAVYTVLAICALVPSGLFQLPPVIQPCTTQGSFPIVDGTCQNYYICIYNGATFQAYSAMCASPTLFNPIVSSCLAGYTCTQTTTPKPTTTPSTTTTPIPCPAIPASVCPRNGRFSVGDPTCKTYRRCYSAADIVINQNMTCPNELIFNCLKEKCVRPADYVCSPTKLS